ncbi:unnamed protein product, partial [Meganyctiphanes norvegica]
YFVDHVNHKTSWEDPRLKNAPPPPSHAEIQGQENQLPQVRSATPSKGPNNDNRGRESHISNASNSSTAHLQHPLQDITDRIEQEELALAKISAMFPTVPEQHIKDLMKKYHNREAVVISALQVQKHPLATPGPYGFSTPPPMRHFIPTATALMGLQSLKASIAPTNATTTSITALPDNRKDFPEEPYKFKSSNDENRYKVNGQDEPNLSSVVDKVFESTTSKPTYEKARGTHFFDEKSKKSPIISHHNSMERSVGSPLHGRSSIGSQHHIGRTSIDRSVGSPFLNRDISLLSSRPSSPHTTILDHSSPHLTLRSGSEFTRSLMGSPRPDLRFSPRPAPHSPKIKLRYLKGIFPKVEPTILLDTLTSCDYSIKEASEKLVSMGFHKKETYLAPPRLKEEDQRKKDEEEKLKLALAARASPGPPRPKNLTEKHKKR